MIRFSDNLYVSDSIKEHKLPLYKLGIRQGRGKLKLYLLVLSNNEHDQLDIIHNSILKQRAYRKLDINIVGLANSYDEALSIVDRILNECMENDGSCNMKEYLHKHFRNIK